MEYNLNEKKAQFIAILNDLEDSLPSNSQTEFLDWALARLKQFRKEQKQKNGKFGKKEEHNPKKMLCKIAKKIRELADLELNLGPCNRTAADEQIHWPVTGPFADCKPENVLHADWFLFDEDDLRRMESDGLVKLHYCRRCNSSKNIAPIQQISHSLSQNELHHLFGQLLPSLGICLDGKTLVDIGSRLGAVLYAAALYCPKIGRAIGIEQYRQFHAIQQQILLQFALSPPIELINSDFRDCAQVLTGGKDLVVVMHNVFMFFMSDREQVACWHWLHSTLRAGTVLIHSPSMEAVTAHLGLGFAIGDWLETLHSAKGQAQTEDGIDGVVGTKCSGSAKSAFEHHFDCDDDNPDTFWIYRVKAQNF